MSLENIMSNPFFLPFVLPFLGVAITAYLKITPLSKSIFDGSKSDFNLGFDFAIAAQLIFIVEISNMLKNADSPLTFKYFTSILTGTFAFLFISLICLELIKKYGTEEYQVKLQDQNGQFQDINLKRYNMKAFIISWVFGILWSIFVVFYTISIGEY